MRKRITAFIDKQVLSRRTGLRCQCPLYRGQRKCGNKAEKRGAACKRPCRSCFRTGAWLYCTDAENAEKDFRSCDFAAQKYDILVATTVIEVGVDAERQSDGGRGRRPESLVCRSCTSCADVSAAVHGSRTACSSARTRDRSRGSVWAHLCRTGDGFEVVRAPQKQRSAVRVIFSVSGSTVCPHCTLRI